MTTEQFRRMLNSNYGIKSAFPKEMLVDADTYANVCQAVFNRQVTENEDTLPITYGDVDGPKGWCISLCLGVHNGIMFKNVELILKS